MRLGQVVVFADEEDDVIPIILPEMTAQAITDTFGLTDVDCGLPGFRIGPSQEVDAGVPGLVSRKDATYSRFRELRERMTLEHDAILDGEIVCLDDQGRSQFYDLMFNRAEAHFYAFDLLWLDGEDLRDRPLVERKATLKEEP